MDGVAGCYCELAVARPAEAAVARREEVEFDGISHGNLRVRVCLHSVAIH
jgi:hypothetical protein